MYVRVFVYVYDRMHVSMFEYTKALRGRHPCKCGGGSLCTGIEMVEVGVGSGVVAGASAPRRGSAPAEGTHTHFAYFPYHLALLTSQRFALHYSHHLLLCVSRHLYQRCRALLPACVQ